MAGHKLALCWELITLETTFSILKANFKLGINYCSCCLLVCFFFLSLYFIAIFETKIPEFKLYSLIENSFSILKSHKRLACSPKPIKIFYKCFDDFYDFCEERERDVGLMEKQTNASLKYTFLLLVTVLNIFTDA